MKRFMVFLGAFLVCSTVILGAVNLQHVIPVGSEVYSLVRMLYLEAGAAPPSSSGPWSAAELLHHLDRIPQDRLTQEGKAIMEEVRAMVEMPDTKDKTFHGSIGFEPTFEMYYHTNDVDYAQETDWVYNYDSRKPLVGIPIELYMTDHIYSKVDFAIMKTRFSRNSSSVTDSSEIFSPKFTMNHPFSEGLNHIDLNFPERAMVGMGIGRNSLTLGRDDLYWSSGKTGSLTVGDHLDYYDFLRFTSFHDKFKYTYLVAGFDSPSWTGGQDSTIDSNDAVEGDSDNVKVYVAHRFEFRMFKDRVTMALTEAMMYQSSTLDFRYLNPALFYHNLFTRSNSNSTLALELSVNPFKYLHVWANFLVDEFPYPGEDQTSNSARPTGVGQQYGIEGMYPMGPGFITGWFEYVKTDPYLYLRNHVDYIVNRRMFNLESDIAIKKNFMGYEYGNDLIMVATGFGYTIPRLFSGTMSASYMLHGENSMSTAWGEGPTHVNKTTPWDDPLTAATVEKSLIISANAQAHPFQEASSKHLRNIGVMTQVDYLKHWNRDNAKDVTTDDIQVTFGVSWKL
jgi:hypothetical protein